jgi:hypothetical protein
LLRPPVRLDGGGLRLCGSRIALKREPARRSRALLAWTPHGSTAPPIRSRALHIRTSASR